MSHYLGYPESELERLKAFWTAKEIEQQPSCWRKTHAIYRECWPAITSFMQEVTAHKDLSIVMTGAGTSAFAGRALAPVLTEMTGKRVEAIATTDLVSNPYQYFAEDIPTLLVSFARSGNSPESVAAVELADQCLTNCYHLVLTCNSEGKLYQSSVNNSRCYAFLMPEETNDQSFAMTSSFTSMMLAAYSVVGLNYDHSKEIERLSSCSEDLLKEINNSVSKIADLDVNRVIFLGSGGLQGLAQESGLKLLELTAGQVVATHDSPLGFRHGPKSIVNEDTLIFVYISNNPYTRKYDLDLLSELRRDNTARKVIAITAQLDEQVIDGDYWHVPTMEEACDAELLFPYILFAQIYAFHRALKLGNTPDNPCPTGEVNRVVQGVTIHNFDN